MAGCRPLYHYDAAGCREETGFEAEELPGTTFLLVDQGSKLLHPGSTISRPQHADFYRLSQ